MDLRTYYAPEVEQALVGLIWQEPKLLERLLRELDPAIHFVQPHLRHILEAIRIGYAQLGAVDWCVVVQILREQKLLEQVGELQTLDELWRNPGYSALFDVHTTKHPDQTWRIWIRLCRCERSFLSPHGPQECPSIWIHTHGIGVRQWWLANPH